MAPIVFLGLGSNMGDSAEILRAAVNDLSKLSWLRLEAFSSVYRSAAVGYADQPDFLNAVAAFSCEKSPEILLENCMAIEQAHGRVRRFRNGPRTLDIDILFFEGETRASEQLTLPHPRAAERAFVMLPLAEIMAQAHPWSERVRKQLPQAANNLADQPIVCLGDLLR